MQTYNHFIKYYDEIVRGINSPLTQEVEYLDEVIKEYKPDSKEILEIACGTWVVSKELIGKWYKAIGLDINENMLAKAKENIWEHNTVLWDMISYDMEKEFDIVLCNYNSICHLLDFEDWKKTFANAYKHLKKWGLFIFDINTIWEFESITEDFSGFYNFAEDTVCLEMFKKFEHDPNSYYKWTHYEWLVKMFIREWKGFDNAWNKKYTLIEEVVRENSFEIVEIKAELEVVWFTILKIEDFHTGEQGWEDSERVYFIARK